MNSLAMRYHKSWVVLTCSTSTSALHHPSVLNISSIEDLNSKSKLTYLVSIWLSSDPLIKEITSILEDRDFNTDVGVTQNLESTVSVARSSISPITQKTFEKIR